MPSMQRSYSVEELIDGYAGELDIDKNKRTHISPSEAIALHIHTEHIRNPNLVSITSYKWPSTMNRWITDDTC